MSNQVQPELQTLLARLKGRIRRYVFLEGTALVLATLGLLFWISLGLDHAWFQISRLELPVWFRALFDFAVVSLISMLGMIWVVLRLFRSFRAKALALVLERRFPEFNDRLVTAVELAESSNGSDTELTAAMLNRTVEEAVRTAGQLDLTSVFDRRPMRKALTAATALVISIVALAVVNQSALATWKASFVDLNPNYWTRNVSLTIHVIAQPGDMEREFQDGSYKHPRGGDFTLLIKADDSEVIPDRVQLVYRMASGKGRGTVLCTKVGDRRFRHTITGLLDDLEFRIYGGDFVTREPYQVKVVEPPRLDGIVLACDYPGYTGMKNPDSTPEKPLRDRVSVIGTQVAIPAETEFLFEADSNKPLVGVRLQLGLRELEIKREAESVSALLTTRTEEGDVTSQDDLSGRASFDWLTDGNRKLTIPFLLSNAENEGAVTRIARMTQADGLPIVLAPDTQVRVFLEDADGIFTAEPTRLLINGIPDRPPVVETKLRGIGTSITRKASIPVLGRIMDDYGLADVRFTYQVNDEAWKTLPIDAAPFERFNVVPLDLSLGQRLVVAVVGEDEDNLNGPHVTRGERYSFKIVSNEELLSQLYQRELNLRQQFERIITEAKLTQQDLILHRARSDERRRLRENEDPDDDTKERVGNLSRAITACAERSLHAVRKNANECASIELAFQDIREELVNNALHTPQTLERLNDKIIKPLHAVNGEDYPAVDQAIGLFRLANERGNDPVPTIDASVEAIGLLIRNLESVLVEMRKLETFQEALEQLKAIIEQQEQLIEKTKRERKKGLLKDLLN